MLADIFNDASVYSTKSRCLAAFKRTGTVRRVRARPVLHELALLRATSPLKQSHRSSTGDNFNDALEVLDRT
jgi:hypothetical protein